MDHQMINQSGSLVRGKQVILDRAGFLHDTDPGLVRLDCMQFFQEQRSNLSFSRSPTVTRWIGKANAGGDYSLKRWEGNPPLYGAGQK